ncbi:gamma-glutamylcyclotransferase [Pseudonocardia sp. C8]|uniref:allophanate hydrolase-related protein n=1 Tax=Pseudonocardia sp. C8 TaxID=2762759 RepID=UPI00351CAD07
MKGGSAHHLIAGSPFLGEYRTVAEYRLFCIRDRFPALCPVETGGFPIRGELYDVPLRQLREISYPPSPPSWNWGSSCSTTHRRASPCCSGRPSGFPDASRTSPPTVDGGSTCGSHGWPAGRTDHDRREPDAGGGFRFRAHGRVRVLRTRTAREPLPPARARR